MIINIKNIQDNMKILRLVKTNVTESFCYINPINKKLFISNNNTAISMSLEMECEEEDHPMVFLKEELFHVIEKAVSILQIKSDYSYKAGLFRGAFQKNEAILQALEGIESMFPSSEEESLFTLDEDIQKEITNAQIYVNEDDANPSSRGIHFVENRVASSSLFRIYTNTISTNINAFVPASMIKFLLESPLGTKVYKKDGIMKIVNPIFTIVFAGLVNVGTLPVTEDRFLSIINTIKNNTKISLNVKDTIDRLSFLSYFASKKNNSMTKMILDKEKKVCYYSVDENTVEINFEEDIENDVDFFISLQSILDALSKISKKNITNTFSIFCDSLNKLLILEFEENQMVILSKINA